MNNCIVTRLSEPVVFVDWIKLECVKQVITQVCKFRVKQ